MATKLVRRLAADGSELLVRYTQNADLSWSEDPGDTGGGGGGGDASAANQTTGNASLSSIDTKIPAQGQALAAASLPVVLPAAQITTLTPPAAITGFATSANQTTGNTSLAAIDTNTAPGTKITAAVMPTGGVGPIGWLSAVWYQLTQILTAKLSLGGTDVSTSNPLPVQQAGVASAPFHDVTQVTAGAASGALLAAGAKRYDALILNTSTTETVWCDDGTAVVGSGFPIYPRCAVRIAHQEAMNVIRGGSSDVTLSIIEEYAT